MANGKISRFRPILRERKKGNGYRIDMSKAIHGRYVLFEDHVKRIASLRNELSTQETLRNRIRDLEEENERLRSICSSHEGKAYGFYDFQ